LLLVFLMAAAIAISLYLEMPRVAFESQRQKEQLLIERGEQYKRAIQLFVSTKGMGRWPAKLEDLENTNNRRFLRHKFVDPFTGKADWRLIHIQNGVLTDSALNKQKKDGDKKEEAVQSSVGALAGASALAGVLGAPVNPGQQNLNPALRRRVSDGGTNPVAIGPDGQPVPGGAPGSTPAAPPYPGAQLYPGAAASPAGAPAQPYPGVSSYPGMPSFPGSTPGVQSYPGGSQLYPGGGYVAGSQPGSPGSIAPGSQPGQFPGQFTPYPGMPGPPVSSQTGGVSPTPYPTQPGSQGTPPNFPQPGLQGINPAQANAAAQIINRILMTPNPIGIAGIQGGPGNVMGGGIAGVASTVEDEGIMVYNDRSKYNEWEFIYDYSKVKPLANPNAGRTVGGPASQAGSGQLGTNPLGGAGSGLFTQSTTGQAAAPGKQ